MLSFALQTYPSTVTVYTLSLVTLSHYVWKATCLEKVCVQALAIVVGPLDSAAHAGRQPLHLNAYALDVSATFVPANPQWRCIRETYKI
jgi:hypothetical protein